ncbi:nitronate monooxygenase family protein [Patulibacter sp.]|uniref:NAD(P)H-dependent flavin oxidoreductase n=1 Tax=Patulibacter sp. TaxID=1912859 RepID=UPI0027159D6F|nr:nitronate monooxygenase [Patulibacter sp.]MDO9410232.1 nitronate monooxygenase [Patulibacter sp.]
MTTAPPLPFAPGRAPRLPVWAAPMAGGPSSTSLIAAVGAAGGLGVLPGGYLSPAAFEERLDALEAATSAPWAVNLFLPGPPTADPAGVEAHAARLGPVAAAHGVALGDPRWEDDGIDAKVDLVLARRPAAVTLTFGCPAPELVARIREATGAVVLVTTTTPEEAVEATAAGVDGLVVQGAEAGGHRGAFRDDPALPGGGELVPLLELLARTRAATPLPLVAAGGLMGGADVRAALTAGASGVQLGTALLCTPEAGTSEVHRRALLDRRYPGTTVTRGFTGRPARGLANPLALAHPDAPSAYPEVHHLTRPLRAAAAEQGDPDAVHLWAGEGWRAVTEEPAADLVARIAHEAGLEG